jgi:hypothetical protein
MIRLAAVLALVLCSLPAGAETRAWDFRVFLDDREIGRHRFALRADGAERELRSEARFEVKLLGFTAYRYAHEATERWAGDCLRSLTARTEDNGEKLAVDWRAEAGECRMSFAYWNPRILEAAGRLLNAQTGAFVAVTVQPQGEETIEVRGRPAPSRRYRLSGPDLAIDLWFSGRDWVALESTAKGGRRLRYRLI